MNPALISTFFYIGRLPWAPGTWASLVTLPIAAAILHFAGPAFLVAVALLVTGIGISASKKYGDLSGTEDPSDCVIDEVAGQLFACAFAPFSIAGFAAAFVLFRFFDITKIWPVSVGEKLPGGVGVMMDDVIAGLLTGIILVVFVDLGIL